MRLRRKTIILAAASIAVSISSAQATLITDGLVGHWTFDETGGSTLRDSTTNANHGTLFNFPQDNSQWVPGKIGGALQFRGPTYQDYIIVPNYPKPSTAMTLSVWIWVDERPPDWAFVICDWVGNCGQFHLGLFGGVDIANQIATTSCEHILTRENVPFPVRSWQHVVLVADSSTIRLYRNATQVSAVAYDGTIFQPTVKSFGIGCRPYDDGTGPGSIPWMWQGKIDDLGIWSRALNAQEVQAIYNGGLAGMDLSRTDNLNDPDITIQPKNQSVAQGADITLSVAGTGTQPLSYQWESNGTNIPGATGATLSLPNIRENQAGRFRAVVSNSRGSRASHPAMVRVDGFSILPIFDLLQADWLTDDELVTEMYRLKQQVGENRVHFRVGFSSIYPQNPLASTTPTNTITAYELYRRFCRLAQENNLSLGVIIGFATHGDIFNIAGSDFRNFQWRLDGVTWQGALNGNGDPLYPDRDYRVVTPSRYATTLRAGFESLARAQAAELVALMNEFPGVIGVVNAVIEEELASAGQSNDAYLGDYSPYAITEFRDWLRHTGKYDDTTGQFATQGAPASIVGPFVNINGALRSPFYDDPSPSDAHGTGQSFNERFGTSFTRWNLRYWDLEYFPASITNASFTPAPQDGSGYAWGGFDAPRVRQTTNAFWRAWSWDYQDQGNSYPAGNPVAPAFGFRQLMVKNFANDLLGWVANAGVPPELLYPHQITGELVGADRNRSGATPIWTGILSLNGQLGNTRFGPLAVDQLQQYSRNWGIFEWHPLPYSSPNDPALYNSTFTAIGSYYNAGARVLFPGWWFKTGEPVDPIFPLPDSNFARGLKDWVKAQPDGPLPPLAGTGVIASMIAPSSGTVFSGDSIELKAYATGWNSLVTNVEFLADNVSIGEAHKIAGTRNWALLWTGAISGTHLLAARAFNSTGGSVTSPPIQIRINAPPMLSYAFQGAQLTLSWPGMGFNLQSSTAVSGAMWADVPGGTNSPFTVWIEPRNNFYRLYKP